MKTKACFACVSLLICSFSIGVLCVRHEYKTGPMFHTVVTSTDTKTGETKRTNGSTEANGNTEYRPVYRGGSYIDVQVMDKPHNLFIGRCLRNEEELHREKIVLNNDGKSHVTAVIRLNVDDDGQVEISCVKVHDEAPGIGAYPFYVGGGVGYNYVEIGVNTIYGKGFEFFVQIFGKVIKDP